MKIELKKSPGNDQIAKNKRRRRGKHGKTGKWGKERSKPTCLPGSENSKSSKKVVISDFGSESFNKVVDLSLRQ